MHRILCFGDSITFGIGENPHKSWCGRLKYYFEPNGKHNAVYNLGVPGHTSADLLKRFDTEAAGRIMLKRPQTEYLILISIGTNDCRWEGMPEENNPRTKEEKFKKNIQELIDKAKNYKAKMAFIGLTPVDEKRTLPFEDTSFKNERVKVFNDIVKETCKKNKVFFLDMFSLMSGHNCQKLLEDGVHPNSEGYDFMFEKIKYFLKENNLI